MDPTSHPDRRRQTLPWQPTWLRPATWLAVTVALLLGATGDSGCGDDSDGGDGDELPAPDLGPDVGGHDEPDGGPAELRPGLTILLPSSANQTLTDAAMDVLSAWLAMSSDPDLLLELVMGDAAAAGATQYVEVIVAGGTEEALGPQTYRLLDVQQGAQTGVQVVAGSQVAAMYALYELLADAGVRYPHPREGGFFPRSPGTPLPQGYGGELRTPAFALRGFHEHTQHPIVMSDALLRSDSEQLRGFVSDHLRWLARNRQNLLTFHLLKTVDLDAWVPYMADIVSEAEPMGIKVGAVFSFVDQQQNCFRLINEGALGPEGEPLSDEEQIRRGLDAVLASGLELIGLQIGSSEFTKPADADVLRWLNAAVEHLRNEHPGVDPYAWIHVTCSLESDAGGRFFHLPLQADGDLGALVHTTMFYTLSHPAPVYDCEDFGHQLAFLEAAQGQRPQVFFPETAWWLGFDNNVPLVLPVTGWSREHDILQTLPAFAADGHLTFTSGREWTYWQYDHYLTRVTWDGATTWAEYLEWIKPAYGEEGEPLLEALAELTAIQVRHLYEDNPLLYFYLAGELPQDEIGAAAGILARRPKPAFRWVLDLEDEEFRRWRDDEYVVLGQWEMDVAQALGDVLDNDPGGEGEGEGVGEGESEKESEDPGEHEGDGEGRSDPDVARRVRELRRGLYLLQRRFAHTLALYASVISARRWEREKLAAQAEGRPADASAKEHHESQARATLQRARSISAAALEVLQLAEADYRYPVEWLARDKPDSLTAYPFGYLSETSTAYFWTRRDEQLAGVLDAVFNGVAEAWEHEPELLWVAPKGGITLTEPANPQAAALIGAFVPQMLFGLLDAEAAPMAAQIVVAEDYDESLLPDPGTEATVRGTMQSADRWEGALEELPLVVHDTSGGTMGTIRIVDAALRFDVRIADGRIAELLSGELMGGLTTESLLAVVTSIDGLDEEGALTLLKAIYELEEVPAVLPFGFAFELRAAG